MAVEPRSVPKPNPGCDVTRLPLGAREGFVLSRIDGVTTIADVALMSALPLDEVIRILERLTELRAVYFGDAPPPAEPPPVANANVPSPNVAPKAVDVAATSMASVSSSRVTTARRKPSPGWDPKELEIDADLDRELKREILNLHSVVDELSHYELLGVARSADRKAVKSAYYALAAKFHTDRYFGKQLGPFKAKMEQIFARVTLAHDTLANRKRREEYDAYLIDRERTRAFERYLAGEDAFDDEPEATPAIDAAPAAPIGAARSNGPPIVAARSDGAPIVAARDGAPIVAARSDGAPASAAASTVHVAVAAPSSRVDTGRNAAVRIDDPQARKEALARRLGITTARQRAIVAPDVPVVRPSTPEQQEAARQLLHRRYAEGRAHALREQVRRYVTAAEEALSRKDVVAAANHLRLAVKYDETDLELRARYQEVNARARDVMAETYLKQAKYEEQAGKWESAAASYIKAHEGRPDDADICDRAAHALRMDGRDLHKAARFGELAVQKNPTHAPFRVTLGAIYLDAGLALRARSELEQAAKLDPKNAVIRDLLAKAKRMAG